MEPIETTSVVDTLSRLALKPSGKLKLTRHDIAERVGPLETSAAIVAKASLGTRFQRSATHIVRVHKALDCREWRAALYAKPRK
jgi:hypothetical protein